MSISWQMIRSFFPTDDSNRANNWVSFVLIVPNSSSPFQITTNIRFLDLGENSRVHNFQMTHSLMTHDPTSNQRHHTTNDSFLIFGIREHNIKLLWTIVISNTTHTHEQKEIQQQQKPPSHTATPPTMYAQCKFTVWLGSWVLRNTHPTRNTIARHGVLDFIGAVVHRREQGREFQCCSKAVSCFIWIQFKVTFWWKWYISNLGTKIRNWA